MTRARNPKDMTIGEIGFSMKCEALNAKDDVIIVSKELWLSIAEKCMDTAECINEAMRCLKK